MTKGDEYKGYWFLADNLKNKIAGILYYQKDEEIILELIGSFETQISEILSFRSFDIVQGITHKNEKITLFNCRASGSWNLDSGCPITKYNCQYLIIGKHLAMKDEKIFNAIEIDMTYLYDWCPVNMIRQSVAYSNNEFTETKFSLSHSDYCEEIFKIDDNFNLKFYGRSEANGTFDRRETKLTQNTLCKINSPIARYSFTTLLEVAGIFRQFLSLASLTSVEYLKITLFDNDDFHGSENERRRIAPISLHYIDKTENIIKSRKPNFLFFYSDIVDGFPDVIKKWYSVKNELAPIRKHLIESIKPKQVFINIDFLIVVQALEGYHTRFVEKKRVKLEVRIWGLIKLFIDIQKISTNPIDVTHVVSSRDYYSHFYEDDTNVLKGVELYNLTNQLKVLLICCVLHLIGFDNKLIDRLLNQNDWI